MCSYSLRNVLTGPIKYISKPIVNPFISSNLNKVNRLTCGFEFLRLKNFQRAVNITMLDAVLQRFTLYLAATYVSNSDGVSIIFLCLSRIEDFVFLRSSGVFVGLFRYGFGFVY